MVRKEASEEPRAPDVLLPTRGLQRRIMASIGAWGRTSRRKILCQQLVNFCIGMTSAGLNTGAILIFELLPLCGEGGKS